MIAMGKRLERLGWVIMVVTILGRDVVKTNETNISDIQQLSMGHCPPTRCQRIGAWYRRADIHVGYYSTLVPIVKRGLSFLGAIFLRHGCQRSAISNQLSAKTEQARNASPGIGVMNPLTLALSPWGRGDLNLARTEHCGRPTRRLHIFDRCTIRGRLPRLANWQVSQRHSK
jgi:hypothetical protein